MRQNISFCVHMLVFNWWNGNDACIPRQLYEQGSCIMDVLRRWENEGSKINMFWVSVSKRSQIIIATKAFTSLLQSALFTLDMTFSVSNHCISWMNCSFAFILVPSLSVQPGKSFTTTNHQQKYVIVNPQQQVNLPYPPSHYHYSHVSHRVRRLNTVQGWIKIIF